jgi:hypothetical protein
MRPPAITVDFGSLDSDTRSSSEFEEISYPPSYNWSPSHLEDELPLHYMTEEKARRRVVRGPGTASSFGSPNDGFGREDYVDDEGKEYHKPRYVQHRLGSGRLPQPLTPPPTTIVRLSNLNCIVLRKADTAIGTNPRENSSCKISSTSLQSSTHCLPVGRVSTTSESRMLSSGTKRTSGNSAHTTSSASFTLMYTRRLGR